MGDHSPIHSKERPFAVKQFPLSYAGYKIADVIFCVTSHCFKVVRILIRRFAWVVRATDDQ